MMISKDVEFDEEGAWNSKVDDCEKYDFLLVFYEKDERYEGHQKLVTSQRSLINSTSHLSYSSSESLSSSSPPSPPRKMKSFDDLCEIINSIDDDLTLYYYLVTCKHIVFGKAIKNKELL
jgi:hypothetical protein